LSIDAHDIKDIIGHLQDHDLHGIWPEYKDSKDDEDILDDDEADEYATDDEVPVQDETDDELSDTESGDDFASDNERSSSADPDSEQCSETAEQNGTSGSLMYRSNRRGTLCHW
jgi:hypothetical protein